LFGKGRVRKAGKSKNNITKGAKWGLGEARSGEVVKEGKKKR